ncbi:hypothetical protein [Hydrogenovibrio marinus]|uniref:hypothetical protein n=1 Tax=Hydrogenovibrio marinus TaxID=28885 RepID=UPI0004A7422A|nr:hypothetical protein [Hydrogenovibrio marinus]
MKRKVQVSQIILLPEKDSGIQNLIARISGHHINDHFKRREPVVIVNQDNGEKIIRYVLGHGSVPGITKESIAVDYDGLASLGFRMKKEGVPQPCNLVVRKLKPFESYMFFTRHPDLGIQMSIKLGLVGVFLGFVGLALGIISLI